MLRLFFTFSKGVQWASLESLPSEFWPLSLMFDTLFYCFSIALFILGSDAVFMFVT